MKYLIIGSSAAGVAAAKTIRARDTEGKITIIAKDSFFYSRCQLHLVCSGRRDANKIKFMADNWAEYLKINFIGNTEVIGIDIKSQTVTTNSNRTIEYDKLLVATGSSTRMPPIKNLEGANLFGLRNIADAEAIRTALPQVKKVAIIGAGLVGCELAAEVAKAGYEVSIIELAPHPLPLQLEDVTGELCTKLLEANNIKVYCSELASEVVRNSNGTPRKIILKSGKEIEAELIVCAAGVQANTALLTNSGVKINRGIVIDEYSKTSLDNIYAAGDVTETEDVILNQIMPSAIWPIAVHQGKTAGINMTGGSERLTRNTGLKASVALLGSNAVSLGCIFKPDPTWDKKLFKSTDSRGRLNVKVFYIDKTLLKGAILWGNVVNAGVYGEAIINRRDISAEIDFLDQLDGAKRGTEELKVI